LLFNFLPLPSQKNNNMTDPIKLAQSLELARNTILLEVKAVASLEHTIDTPAFSQVISLLHECTGRVVVTGIGKSAIIAQKIVATFNSTGTPALFMHAADAVHGDLGIITSRDIIICLSKSGGTPEISTLVSFLSQLDNPLIAITAEPDSYLAQQADHVLLTPFKQEADPNNLAPTTSSTAQLALGDALAMGLLHLKGFDRSDFARFHPGGALGKQLHLQVQQLSQQHERPAIHLDANVREAIVEISSKRLGVTAVLDHDEKLCGIVTDGDLRRMLNNHSQWENLSIKDIMTPNPKSVSTGTLATEALRIMRKYSITQLPVMDGDLYLGIVHLHDMIKEGIFDAS